MTSLRLPNTVSKDIRWNADGLIAAIAQEVNSHEVLMLAWMNQEALSHTIQYREAYYWSRSRQTLWHKGEQSGHIQKVHEIYLDCDGDAILLRVTQKGLACHTGRRHCFFRKIQVSSDSPSTSSLKTFAWKSVLPVLKAPEEIYQKTGIKTHIDRDE